MSTASHPLRRVRFHAGAADDMRALATRSRALVTEALRMLVLLQRGTIAATPLRDFTKTGDLSDCGKIVVAVDGEPEHRIVVQQSDGVIEVIEVVAVEDRTGDLPYLLAGLRLGRLDDPVRRSDAQRRVARIRRLLDRE